MRTNALHRLQRLTALIALLCLLGIGWMVARAAGVDLDEASLALSPRQPTTQIALISGHAGYDAGAVCQDAAGQAVLTEAEVNARVAERVAALLRSRGSRVLVLNEFDDRLTGLRADVLLSLHADSCIALSGYKAAHRLNSPIVEEEARLLACIDTHYAETTGLASHPNTITHDMTDNHAFRRIDPQTPAAILEMGFLGGDQTLLTSQPDRVAQGIAESIRCFLAGSTEPSE